MHGKTAKQKWWTCYWNYNFKQHFWDMSMSHWHENVCQASLFKNFLPSPFKSNDFLNICRHYMNRTFILWPPPYTLVEGRRSQPKTGLWVSTCLSCGGASRGRPLFVTVARWRRKISRQLSPWHPLVKLCSPDSRLHTTKSGRGHTANESNFWAQHRVLQFSSGRGNRLTNFFRNSKYLFKSQGRQVSSRNVWNCVKFCKIVYYKMYGWAQIFKETKHFDHQWGQKIIFTIACLQIQI
jgi:hypothetical protein